MWPTQSPASCTAAVREACQTTATMSRAVTMSCRGVSSCMYRNVRWVLTIPTGAPLGGDGVYIAWPDECMMALFLVPQWPHCLTLSCTRVYTIACSSAKRAQTVLRFSHLG